MSRYIVTELVGYLQPSTGSTRTPPGLSCQIIDTLVMHRLIATYRSEDFNRLTYDGARAHVRRLASDHAARLNG